MTKTFLFCTNYKNKDKYANEVFLKHFYANEIPKDKEVTQEIIWSDGPTSEFKNRFTVKIMESLSRIHGKEFVWKFSVTSHGKGVVDGIGGNVISTVRQKRMSRERQSNCARF